MTRGKGSSDTAWWREERAKLQCIFDQFKQRRPTEPTVEVRRALVRLIRMGAWDYTAAGAIGILPERFRAWLERGKQEPHGIYGRFAEEIRNAKERTRRVAEERVRRKQRQRRLAYRRSRLRKKKPGTP